MTMPIGKFEMNVSGGWVCCSPDEACRYDGSVRLGYRFRANTGLKDKDGEWIYTGDKVWSVYCEQWFSVCARTSGAWFLEADDGTDAGEVWSACEYLTHTPPVKKYKRRKDTTVDMDGYTLTGATFYESYDQRTGVTDRRKGNRRIAYKGIGPDWPVVSDGSGFGRRVDDRRKAKGGGR